MKGFFAWLFSENTSSMHITLFSIWHFFYLALILGGTALLAVRIRKKEKREKLLRIMAYTVIGLYVADFFIMPLSDSYGMINTEKLPFHICTLMGVVVPFVQFNKKLAFARTPVVFLSVAASIVWMCYPGSALGGQPPFCYRTFQTFMYHGVLFCWGVLNLAYGAVTPNIKKCWKELCGILMIYVWAWFGNTVYGGSGRCTGGLMVGNAAVITGNAFVNNTVIVEGREGLGNDVCASAYYADIDLSGNYWGGGAPVEGDDYHLEYRTYKVIINDYLTTYGE